MIVSTVSSSTEEEELKKKFTPKISLVWIVRVKETNWLV